MAFGSWTPFRRRRGEGSDVPARRSTSNGGSLDRFQSEMNRMFEEFLGSTRSPWSTMPSQFFGDFSPERFVPRMDLSESDEMLQVSAELPGINPDDVEINVKGDRLHIRGEKRHEETEEHQERGYYRTERSFGAFERTIPLPEEVDADNAQANFKNGVLRIDIPKVETEKSSKKIEVQTG